MMFWAYYERSEGSNDEAKTGYQSLSGQACPEAQAGDPPYVRGRREDPDCAG